jgi:hypothetical protein
MCNWSAAATRQNELNKVSQRVSSRASGAALSFGYRGRTFDAWGSLGPLDTSNSTACPSLNDLYPSAAIAEKWAKTSSPFWRWMNPKPLLALNDFTVPIVPLVIHFRPEFLLRERGVRAISSFNYISKLLKPSNELT